MQLSIILDHIQDNPWNKISNSISANIFIPHKITLLYPRSPNILTCVPTAPLNKSVVTILASMWNLINFSLAHYKIHAILILPFCQDQLHKNFHLLLSCKIWCSKIILWKVAWNYRDYIHNLDVLYQLMCEMKSSPPKNDEARNHDIKEDKLGWDSSWDFSPRSVTR